MAQTEMKSCEKWARNFGSVRKISYIKSRHVDPRRFVFWRAFWLTSALASKGFTAAGQRRNLTVLSPFPSQADPWETIASSLARILPNENHFQNPVTRRFSPLKYCTDTARTLAMHEGGRPCHDSLPLPDRTSCPLAIHDPLFIHWLHLKRCGPDARDTKSNYVEWTDIKRRHLNQPTTALTNALTISIVETNWLGLSQHWPLSTWYIQSTFNQTRKYARIIHFQTKAALTEWINTIFSKITKTKPMTRGNL